MDELLKDVELLTEDEHRVVELLAEAANLYTTVSMNDGVQTVNNRNEFATRIHDCQNMVLARAAARAYPGRYRL